MNKKLESNYVLITSAKNEEAYIENTILSVISQTILPIKWIIVSDGSTDRTDEIVKKYVENYHFIQLVHIDTDKKRNFHFKVMAFNIGYKVVKSMKYEFIGNLDADVSFNLNYYECIIAKFIKNRKLGCAGGEIYDFYDRKFHKAFSSPWHVPGPIQLFRRQCFEDIGGYLPLERNVDAVALIMARMKGWEVKKFPNIKIFHHRRAGIAEGNLLFSRFRYGVLEYSCGFHPIYMIVKFINRILEKPYFISSLFILSGYLYALFKREPYSLDYNVIRYLRKEQTQRLKEFILRICSRRKR